MFRLKSGGLRIAVCYVFVPAGAVPKYFVQKLATVFVSYVKERDDSCGGCSNKRMSSYKLAAGIY